MKMSPREPFSHALLQALQLSPRGLGLSLRQKARIEVLCELIQTIEFAEAPEIAAILSELREIREGFKRHSSEWMNLDTTVLLLEQDYGARIAAEREVM